MINPYHLRYFVDAARSGSLSEAAKKNNVSQSAVSQAIRSLERTMGFPLTTHQKKVLNLTDEGHAVLAHADAVFHALDSLSEALAEIDAGHSGPLRLACTNTLASHYLAPVLARLCATHPKLRPVVRIGNSETIKDWLRQGEADVGLIVDDGLTASEFSKMTLHKGRYVLFRSKRANAALPGLVVTRKDRPEVQYVMRRLKHAAITADVQCEFTSWGAIREFVLEHGGTGLCPDYVVEREIRDGRLRSVRSGFPMPRYKLLALHRTSKPLGKNSSLLISALVGHGSTYREL